MTYTEFVNKYYGKYVEFADPSNMYQCVDIMRKYIKEVWGMDPNILPVTLYAKDIFTKFTGAPGLKKIYNTPDNIPSRGDILFLGWWWPVTGIAGHVGMVDSADLYKFVLFNQNYPTNYPCNFRNFNYSWGPQPIVRGWIHKI